MRSLLALLLMSVAIGGEVSVELSATPAQVNVGDPITVSITYRWPRAWDAAEPDPGPAFANSFVTAAPPAERAVDGQGERRTFRLTVLAASSGAWELPRPRFAAKGPAGEVSAEANQVLVQVGPEAAPPQLPKARPLPVRPPPPPLAKQAWPWAVGGVALIAIVVLAWWLRRRAIQAAETPAQRFARDLAAAEAAGDGRAAAAALSLALRRFAGSVWSFDGPGATTRETAAQVRRQAPEGEANDLVRILQALDDLRWAAGDLPTSAIAHLVADGGAWERGIVARLEAERAAREHKGTKP